jgi:Flp pilus assembly protein TadD
MSEVDPPRLFHAAREDALRAIELDDTVAEGHGALAYVSAAYFRDFETAEREFRRAVALNPQTAYRHGFGMALTALGRFDEAQAMFERARQMDPLNVPLAINAARSLFMARRFEEAATALRALGVGQGAWALANLSESAARAGHVAEALRVARSLVGSSLDAVERSSLVCALAQGPADEARRELMALFEVSGGHGVSSQPYPAARAHACLGDREAALANPNALGRRRVAREHQRGPCLRPHSKRSAFQGTCVAVSTARPAAIPRS